MWRTLPLLIPFMSGCWITDQEHDERLAWWHDVSAGYQLSCGLLASSEVECWGYFDEGHEGTFTQVSAGWMHACGISQDRVRCWGDTGAAIISQVPAGGFAEVSTLATEACARDDGGQITCWGDTTSVVGNVPDGEFIRVEVGENFACALGTDYDIACWGRDDSGETAAPAGLFDDIDVSDENACGLASDDSAIVCWGAAEFDELLRGNWEDLAVGFGFACGLDWNGDVSCYDETDEPILTNQPANADFVSIDAGNDYVCGTTDDGRALCWGGNDEGQTDVPHNPPADNR
jgi:alpha-tubulin suppressor-like RCC1 family protein